MGLVTCIVSMLGIFSCKSNSEIKSKQRTNIVYIKPNLYLAKYSLVKESIKQIADNFDWDNLYSYCYDWHGSIVIVLDLNSSNKICDLKIIPNNLDKIIYDELVRCVGLLDLESFLPHDSSAKVRFIIKFNLHSIPLIRDYGFAEFQDN